MSRMQNNNKIKAVPESHASWCKHVVLITSKEGFRGYPMCMLDDHVCPISSRCMGNPLLNINLYSDWLKEIKNG